MEHEIAGLRQQLTEKTLEIVLLRKKVGHVAFVFFLSIISSPLFSLGINCKSGLRTVREREMQLKIFGCHNLNMQRV
jgi:hypothetical protein